MLYASHDRAIEVAMDCANGDDEWEYRVVAAGKYWKIAVYDEDQVFLGYLGEMKA